MAIPSFTAANATAGPDLLEVSQIDALVDAAGVEGVREILNAFWRSTEGLAAELKAQLARGDRTGAMRSAHALKGSALNVGAVRFAETLRKVEDACRGGDLVTASALASAGEADYRATINAFEAHLRLSIRS